MKLVKVDCPRSDLQEGLAGVDALPLVRVLQHRVELVHRYGWNRDVSSACLLLRALRGEHPATKQNDEKQRQTLMYAAVASHWLYRYALVPVDLEVLKQFHKFRVGNQVISHDRGASHGR